jgi:hypothetical protein
MNYEQTANDALSNIESKFNIISKNLTKRVIDRYLATLPNSKTELPFQETDFFSPEY